MIFEIDADIIYTQSCQAKYSFRKVNAKNTIVLRPSRPLKFEIPSIYILAHLEGLSDVGTIFDLSGSGDQIAIHYREYINSNGSSSYNSIEWADVPSDFFGLDFDIFKSECLWEEHKIVLAWDDLLKGYDDLPIDRQDAYANGYTYPQDYIEEDILPFDQFRKEYISLREFQLTEAYLTSSIDSVVDEDLIFIREAGTRANGIWYPSDYHLKGFKNIRSVKMVVSKLKDNGITTVDKIREEANKEAVALYCDNQELKDDLESIRKKVSQNRKSSIERPGRRYTKALLLFIAAIFIGLKIMNS